MLKQRHLFSILFALLLSTLGFAQPDAQIPKGEPGTDFNRTDGKGRKQGLWVKVYQNGSLYYKGEFRDGEPTGTFWFWYDTGEPMRQVEHLDGTRYMLATHYHPNGVMMSRGHYRSAPSERPGEEDRLRDGEWEFFSDEGVLKSREVYQNGIKHGASTSYYDSGALLREEYYVHGKKEGEFKEFFENGRLRSSRMHANDSFHGEVKIFEQDGAYSVKGQYVNGKKDGVWIYFSDGRIRLTTKYKLDEEVSSRRENGEFTDHFPSGIPKSTYHYEDGKRSGPFTEWHDIGEWVRVPMDEPAPGGGIQLREKLINTQIKCEGDYLDDQLEGPVKWYDERGKMIKLEEYVNGQLISSKER